MIFLNFSCLLSNDVTANIFKLELKQLVQNTIIPHKSIVENPLVFFVFFTHFCPGTITTHAVSINSDLQRGLDRRLRHTQH